MAKVHVAGNPALDFVGTVSERGPDQVEELRSAADLADWFVGAGLVDEPPEVSDPELAIAIELREALFRAVTELIDGRAVAAADRDLINGWAARPAPVVQLDEHGRRRRHGSFAAALAAVAAAAVALWDRSDGAVVRWCADERCTHPFLDRSRNKQRRWCDMATCGDRAKVRAYRSRQYVD